MIKNITAFVTMFLLISCAKTIYNSADWQSNKMTIDGKMTEGHNSLRFFDDENDINYNISNDRQNIYLCCSISNEQLQLKILHSGIEFAIDTLGKKSFPVSIKYPYSTSLNPEPVTISHSQPGPGSKGKADRSAYKLKLLAGETDILLTGFKPHLGKVINNSEQDKTGISAAIDLDNIGTMCYEAVIPFSTFYKNELSPSDSNKVFKYRIRVDPAPDIRDIQGRANGARARGDGMRSGMGGGGGMRGGGGMGGGGMRDGGMRNGGMRGGGMNGNEMYSDNGGNGRQRITTISGTTKIQIKLRLAYR